MEIKPTGGFNPITNQESVEGSESSTLEPTGQNSITELPQQLMQDVDAFKKETQSSLGNLSLEGQLIRGKLDSEFSINQAGQNLPETAAAALSTLHLDRHPSTEGVVTTFPNGVQSKRDDGLTSLQPPPGGKVEQGPDSSIIVKDANNHVAAKMDKDGTLHVYTKQGEYSEKNDGSVTFKGHDGNTKPENRHQPGPIKASDYEDYGIATDGKTTRFPNGVDLDKKANRVIIPAGGKEEHETSYGKISKSTGFDQAGNVLYVWDQKGLHIPTRDGTITQTPDGNVTFERNH
jgi:hypothetical protein